MESATKAREVLSPPAEGKKPSVLSLPKTTRKYTLTKSKLHFICYRGHKACPKCNQPFCIGDKVISTIHSRNRVIIHEVCPKPISMEV